MQFKNTQVFNFEGAFHGMRNPMNSWDKSDSWFGIIDSNYPQDNYQEIIDRWIENELQLDGREIEMYSKEWEDLWEEYFDWLYKNGCLQGHNDYLLMAAIGPNDLKLAQRLVRAGDEHAKFMRQIFVSVDIEAPIYFWKEADTYKVSTVANSTSTMHKLATTPITMSCFETDDYDGRYAMPEWENYTYPQQIIEYLEYLRLQYLETKDKGYWKELIRWLPESWLQTRTWTANYAVLRNIYFQRRSHKLTEWHQFCDWVESLPYGKELITLED